ncbi:MAG: hypothetical protein AAFP82_20870, partial [Bacteroidota bacterium]
MELNFDIRGNLRPYDIIEISLEEFKAVFVDSFDEDSKRHAIFEKYLTYMEDFQKIIKGDFYQWIDGSFVTTKYNPKDIDLVTVIHHADYGSNKELITQKFTYPNAQKIYEVDAYVVDALPQNHPNYEAFTKADLLYWENLFSKTRVNRR